MRFSNDETFPKWEPVEGLEWAFETMSKIDCRELWVSWEEGLIHCLFKNSGVIQTPKFGEKTGGTIKRNVNNQIIIVIHKSFFDEKYILSPIYMDTDDTFFGFKNIFLHNLRYTI